MSESIEKKLSAIRDPRVEKELRPLFEAMKADLTAVRSELANAVDDITALRASIVGITAKLDADDVTNLDTDYASLHDPAAQTSSTPDALQTLD